MSIIVAGIRNNLFPKEIHAEGWRPVVLGVKGEAQAEEVEIEAKAEAANLALMILYLADWNTAVHAVIAEQVNWVATGQLIIDL